MSGLFHSGPTAHDYVLATVAYAIRPVSVGSDVSAELTFTLRSMRKAGPSKMHTTVSRNAVSTKLQVMTKLRSSIHVPLATTRMLSISYS